MLFLVKSPWSRGWARVGVVEVSLTQHLLYWTETEAEIGDGSIIRPRGFYRKLILINGTDWSIEVVGKASSLPPSSSLPVEDVLLVSLRRYYNNNTWNTVLYSVHCYPSHASNISWKREAIQIRTQEDIYGKLLSMYVSLTYYYPRHCYFSRISNTLLTQESQSISWHCRMCVVSS